MDPKVLEWIFNQPVAMALLLIGFVTGWRGDWVYGWMWRREVERTERLIRLAEDNTKTLETVMAQTKRVQDTLDAILHKGGQP